MINEIKINIIQEKLKKALALIEKEENVKIGFGSISFNVAQYRATMTVSSLDKSEKVEKVYESICRKLGFTQNIIGMKFDSNGMIYEITDIKTSNRKYPVIALSPKGNSFKYSVDHIKRLIGGDKIINRNKNLDKLLGD
jgi:hypothetical protein